MRRLVYHVSATRDGFIAGPGGEFDFFVVNDDLAETLNARFPETVERIARGRRGPASRYNGTGIIPRRKSRCGAGFEACPHDICHI
ncbi:hypothetical protein GBA63_12210 [Rubrobacter tropicus]|uniref:Bacterial bifunctional deaminase-reductase C-terminal domain-containing protein n=1 Tax=Rubrobacter tropicus TaxID=2653851 RepID=A0A6G8QA07_9ACTN|nr:hypothetical protein [Rubrobacter tropicus]QIN83315.1 hypothetical protein GBA63_12210 [Rubrobacter tropicus]